MCKVQVKDPKTGLKSDSSSSPVLELASIHVSLQLVSANSLAACVHVHSCMNVQEVQGSTPGTETQASILSRWVNEYSNYYI